MFVGWLGHCQIRASFGDLGVFVVIYRRVKALGSSPATAIELSVIHLFFLLLILECFCLQQLLHFGLVP